MFSLQEKRALISGAGSGIGAAVSETFARQGAYVIVVDRDQEAGAAQVQKIIDDGGSAEFLECDVADVASCENVANQVLRKHGHLDILVNNAGIGHVGTIFQTTAEDLDRMYQVNVRGVFNMSKVFIGSMVERKKGSIVNTASIGGVVGLYDRLAYCTTKFAVVGLTKCMALDHAMDGVRVNCVCPGRVETPFVKARLAEYPDPEKAYKEMSASQANGRMGRPEEIAAAMLYLASDESQFVTGSELIIDGGLSAGK
jgi:NAD(P)-dependent dehydrogenase (short-subunit alcohol dehydrogenase family)